MISGTPEYCLREVAALYPSYLCRPADPVGLNGYASARLKRVHSQLLRLIFEGQSGELCLRARFALAIKSVDKRRLDPVFFGCARK